MFKKMILKKKDYLSKVEKGSNHNRKVDNRVRKKSLMLRMMKIIP